MEPPSGATNTVKGRRDFFCALVANWSTYDIWSSSETGGIQNIFRVMLSNFLLDLVTVLDATVGGREGAFLLLQNFNEVAAEVAARAEYQKINRCRHCL